MIEFSCKNCGQKLNVQDQHSGKRVKCPKCDSVGVVPDNLPKIKFNCQNCGQSISVPQIHAGKKGKCPKCKNVVFVPSLKRKPADSAVTVSIVCSICNEAVQVPETSRGQTIECPECGSYIETSSAIINGDKIMNKICPKCSREYDDKTMFCDIDGSKLISVNENVPIVGKEELKTLLHPSEGSRFVIALLVCIPAAIVGLFSVYFTFGAVLVFVGLIVFFIWFSLSIAKAHLIANSVKVSDKNFKEIHEVATEVKYLLDYSKPIDIYIIEEGSVNAMLAKFFRTKFIVLNSALVKDMLKNNKILQMKWIIARFIGALKAKHFRLILLKVIILSIEKIKIFNLFILPYERATQYSGDQIGLAICSDLNQAMIAFDKFMVGNELAHRVEFKGLLEQAIEIKGSFFSLLARLFSTHPHMVSRYLNLLAFARWRYPEMFDNYIKQFDTSFITDINSILPTYYSKQNSHKSKLESGESE